MSRRTKRVKKAGRFGPRYGVKVRRRLHDYLTRSGMRYECPRCEQRKVRRISTGIWRCARCRYEFVGGAYQPKVSVK